MKNKPIIVLAGGFGTRLQSILNGVPKPLADINGMPFISLLLEKIKFECNCNHFILSLFHKADLIIDYFENAKRDIFSDCIIEYVIEPSPLGTGGAIAYVINKLGLNGQLMVLNSDTWIDNGYKDLIYQNNNVIAVKYVDDTRRYGSIILDENDFITAFKEKDSDSLTSGYISLGLYNLNTEYFKLEISNPISLESDIFPEMVKRGVLKAVKLNTDFIDIGIPEDYNRFCQLDKLKKQHDE